MLKFPSSLLFRKLHSIDRFVRMQRTQNAKAHVWFRLEFLPGLTDVWELIQTSAPLHDFDYCSHVKRSERPVTACHGASNSLDQLEAA